MRTIDELVVTNRLGASVMLDAVFRSSRQRNSDSRTGETLAPREWKALNEVFKERLPGVPTQGGAGERGVMKGRQEVGIENSGLEVNQQQDMPPWLGEWENYMDYFEVGAEQWGDIELSMDGWDGFME